MTTGVTGLRSPAVTHKGLSGSWFGKRWVPLVLVFASFVMGFTVTAHHSQALSPIDEWVYADYLYKLPQQPIIERGEKIGPEALELMACVGVREYGPMGAACRAPHPDISKFPQHGISSADSYTPIYFVTTWAAAKAIQLVTPFSLVEAARYTGAFWLAGGMLLFWWFLRLFRVHPVVVLGLGLAVIASPFAWWTYTFVSTDAPSFALGTFALIAAVKYVRGQWSGWWLPLIGAVATLVKISNILGVALVCLYLLIEFVLRRLRSRRRGFEWARSVRGAGDDGLLVVAIASAVAAIAAEAVWLVIQSAVAIGPGVNQGITIPLKALDLGQQFVNFLPGTIVSNVHITGSIVPGLPIPEYLIIPLSWICIAGVIGAFAHYRWRRTNSSLVYAIAIAAIFFAPLLAIALSLMGSYFPIPARYGAVILPGVLLTVGLIVKNRFLMAVLVAYPLTLLIIILIKAPVWA